MKLVFLEKKEVEIDYRMNDNLNRYKFLYVFPFSLSSFIALLIIVSIRIQEKCILSFIS